MKQQCFLWSVWLTWLTLPLLAGFGFYLLALPGALGAVVLGVAGQVLYIRIFPRLSSALGYGSVADIPADLKNDPVAGGLQVTLYTASVCPFCPIVRSRLQVLQQRLGFVLTEVDITLRADLAAARKLGAVPAVEINGQLHFGNLTSAELMTLLTEAGRLPVEAAEHGS